MNPETYNYNEEYLVNVEFVNFIEKKLIAFAEDIEGIELRPLALIASIAPQASNIDYIFRDQKQHVSLSIALSADSLSGDL